jgi:hypothetical protein
MRLAVPPRCPHTVSAFLIRFTESMALVIPWESMERESPGRIL